MMENVGVGFCIGCNRIGPLFQFCEQCRNEDDPEQYIYDTWSKLLEEDEGMCPICNHIGPVGEVCTFCSEWFYVAVPFKLRGPRWRYDM